MRRFTKLPFYLAMALLTAAPACNNPWQEPPLECDDASLYSQDQPLVPFFSHKSGWGYRNRRGKVAIEPRFMSVPQYGSGSPFHEGLAPVGECLQWEQGAQVTFCTRSQVGFIDQTGRFVIPPRFESARVFSEGLAAVRIDTAAWGYIDRTGKVVIQPQFIRACEFRDGVALVRSFELHTYRIDRKGKALPGWH